MRLRLSRRITACATLCRRATVRPRVGAVQGFICVKIRGGTRRARNCLPLMSRLPCFALRLLVVAVLGASALCACDLNPQPMPPLGSGGGAAGGGNSTGGASNGSAGSGSSGGSSGAATPPGGSASSSGGSSSGGVAGPMGGAAADAASASDSRTSDAAAVDGAQPDAFPADAEPSENDAGAVTGADSSHLGTTHDGENEGEASGEVPSTD
jgi:hypothetical protein